MKNKYGIAGVILFIISLFLWVYIITKPAIVGGFDFSQTGQLGDTIGGLTAPLIGIAGAILVYVSFQAQLKANQMQFEALNEEKRRYDLDRWNSEINMEFQDIKIRVSEIKFVIPIGYNDLEMNYDVTIEHSGFMALFALREKLINYNKLNRYQRLSVDYFVFEYGFYLKRIQEFGFNLSIDERFELEKVSTFKALSKFYFNSLKHNSTLIIEALDDNNDPKYVKAELVKTINFIESMFNEYAQ